MFFDGTITGEPEVTTYLGRPWRAYAQTSFIRTEMGAVVMPWSGYPNWSTKTVCLVGLLLWLWVYIKSWLGRMVAGGRLEPFP